MLRHTGGKIGYIYIMQMIKLTISLNMLYKQEERNGKLLRNHHPHHSLTLCGVMDLTVLHGIAHTVYIYIYINILRFDTLQFFNAGIIYKSKNCG